MGEYEKKRRRPPGGGTTGDRLPPHSEEVERRALGCILDKPEEGMNTCQERGVSGEWFYDLRYQVLYTGMREMHDAGKPIDVVLLYEHLKGSGHKLEEWGGLGLLQEVMKDALSFMLDGYLEQLRELYWLRQVVRTGTEMVRGAFSIEEGEKTDAATLVARAEREILRLREEGQENSEARIKEIILEVVNELEEHYARGSAQIRGLTTGLEYLDKILCGMGGDENGNDIVMSARPGTGKTAIALQIADHVALEHVWWEPVLAPGGGPPGGPLQPVKELVDGVERFKVERRVGKPVGIISLEMTRKGLTKRLLFRRAQADSGRWRTGFATSADFKSLAVAAGQLAQPNNIIIEDEGVFEWDAVKPKMRRWVRQYGVGLFVLDYLQLMRKGRGFREDRVRELAEISTEIKEVGKELNVPIIVIAQMNRDYEKEPNRRPRLSDLKDCGQIEQDADVVMFLFKPKLKDEAEAFYEEVMQKHFGQDWSQYPERIDLLVAKARNGPSDLICQLLFQKSCGQFHDWNRWLKDHGHKGRAMGESGQVADRQVLPTNEELGLE